MKTIKILITIVITIAVAYTIVKVIMLDNEEMENIVVAEIPTHKIIETDQVLETQTENNKDTNTKIESIINWSGTDPYESADFANALPELKTTVENFEKKWGQKLHIRQAYRPIDYAYHIRSVWETWRYVNGKSYTPGYKCENFVHIDTKKVGILNQIQKDYLNTEAKRHGFVNGDTPPGCVSDHAKGIAVDITPPFESKEYERFIDTANRVGLCHYIVGDEPHFGLTSQLPTGTDCFVK